MKLDLDFKNQVSAKSGQLQLELVTKPGRCAGKIEIQPITIL